MANLTYTPQEKELAFLAQDILRAVEEADGHEASKAAFEEVVVVLREWLESRDV